MSFLLLAGVGRRDITPPLGSRLMGYANPQRVARSVRDPLGVTALVLEGAAAPPVSQDDSGGASGGDGGGVERGGRAAILSFDLCVPEACLVESVRDAVHARTGIARRRITVSFTQTHSGPNTQECWGWCDRDEPYLATLYPKAADAAAEALAALRPARVGIGTARSEVGINRRAILEDHSVGLGVNPWGPFDPTMTVLRFVTAAAAGEAPAGSPLATLVHYGAHPTVLDGNSPAVSRDWPGVMLDRIEQLTRAPALFLNGAVGDIAPRCNSRGAVGDGEPALMEVGGRAAMDAMSAYHAVKEFRDLPLATLTRGVDLPHRPLPPLEEAQRRLAAAEPGKDAPGGPMCEHRHWSAVVAELSRGAAQASRRFEQTLTAIGPVALVPFPGEPFAETVLRLRQHSPFAHTLAASTTNGSMGYFPTRESLHRGGYEVWVAKAFGPYLLAEHIDDVLVESNLGLLRELYGVVASG